MAPLRSRLATCIGFGQGCQGTLAAAAPEPVRYRLTSHAGREAIADTDHV
jgi:hypothetical protein